ncbi:AsnC family transcriptional regulator [Thiomonas sp. X19]|jgi:DNA-binding Lrp family transcriptional regulator|nr:Bkd operon transcriptional regulator [Thiomonas sp. CB2]CQR44823.1 AsnC family transcriptional regulator [Thiomonas sp. CB3]SCC91879.1 AsnC family transcriptional regulator [Thiomonas sp. X19]VDY05700.1 AsnC family transcriptional regulator [Thiomonas sp. Bio17B3]VDY07135.1 AsnC family transcriptional regulator [Thiomonas sp. Sup16B3]VDY13957.1 AsnC family transcriptional regulator [Thiomonas sp. OC7]
MGLCSKYFSNSAVMSKETSDLLQDSYVRRMIDIVQSDGRITVQALADSIGLSAPPCWRRLRDMEESGLIVRYAALLDRTKLGLDSCMFTQVSLEKHSEAVVADFERAVRAAPEIQECWVITGDADYLLKIYVPDAQAFDRFVSRFMLKIKGVRQLKTAVALREVKLETRLQLPSG